MNKEELEYRIIPSIVDMKLLAEYIQNNLSFNQVLELYLLLKKQFDKPSCVSWSKTFNVEGDE